MSMIKVDNLTFGYESSYDNVFENVSFQIDTDWKLGLIGRNGKGKSTFLQLLMEQNDNVCRPEYRYSGTITGNVCFQYFPVNIPVRKWQNPVIELMDQEFPDHELWKVIRELEYLSMEADILYRTFGSLSFGERTRVMLAYLFSDENNFLLLDEPANHLDMETRETMLRYLKRKQGFILVSHERDFLDSCVSSASGRILNMDSYFFIPYVSQSIINALLRILWTRLSSNSISLSPAFISSFISANFRVNEDWYSISFFLSILSSNHTTPYRDIFFP